ncbi:hypothetical protein K437DRAFT_293319 [Tilletiaria anomala UBC 951]|uniref:UNC-45/Cro1/She4 central domain-containing protein n=1 Tax=Tilletiaria anomala (strain ATCC 24038 / CBS 436.72 / UBC 951) TaxID=1037660 RepID=A0A066WE96_TILAU|nr:uncharacterized protein K437DRAFT_293319 [Tilletiaria anomala UBC 951]KDN52101.1 hypothetical protein K437DRAFT_293319 [Tilletiaria anomala UBC 951]
MTDRRACASASAKKNTAVDFDVARLTSPTSGLSIGQSSAIPTLDEDGARKCVQAFAPGAEDGGSKETGKNASMTKAMSMITIARHLFLLQDSSAEAASNSSSKTQSNQDESISITSRLFYLVLSPLLHQQTSEGAANLTNLRTVYRFLSALFALSSPLAIQIIAHLQDAVEEDPGERILLQPPYIDTDLGGAEAEADWVEMLSTGLSAGKGGFRSLLLESSKSGAARGFLSQLLEDLIDEGELMMGEKAGKVGRLEESSAFLHKARATLYALLIRLKLSRNIGLKNGAVQQLIDVAAVSDSSTADVARNATEDDQAVKFCTALFPSIGDNAASNEDALRSPQILLLPLLELLSLLLLSPSGKRKSELASAKSAPLLSFLASLTPLIAKSRAALFPNRAASSSNASSMYEIDARLFLGFTVHSASVARFDTSLQFLILSILQSITRYPPLLSAEQKQMQRLKKLAEAKQRAASAGSDATNGNGTANGASALEEEEEEPSSEVDKRCRCVVEAGVTALLVAITFAGSPTSSIGVSKGAGGTEEGGGSLNPSPAVREQLVDVFHALVTPQDKLLRGKLAQQGGNRAILALSSSHAHADSETANGADEESTAQAASKRATQALAKLLITANPVLLFTPAQLQSVSVALCRQLWLSPSSTNLQRFEASLALTNIASAGPERAGAIRKLRLLEKT